MRRQCLPAALRHFAEQRKQWKLFAEAWVIGYKLQRTSQQERILQLPAKSKVMDTMLTCQQGISPELLDSRTKQECLQYFRSIKFCMSATVAVLVYHCALEHKGV